MSEYIYTIGRRKTSVATLRLYKGEGKNMYNDKIFTTVYTSDTDRIKLEEPFKVVGWNPKNFYFTAKAVGGGRYSQLDAIKLAIARAIIKIEPELKKTLKVAGLLTRDPRMVERKKPGLRKARRAEQYSKR